MAQRGSCTLFIKNWESIIDLNRYITSEGKPAENFQIAFARFLYNEERHLRSQSVDGWKTFSLLDEQAQKVLAQIHFYVEGIFASSPYKAPFGSIEFNDDLSPDFLFQFLIDVEQRLKSYGVKKIMIKDAPQIYRQEQAALLSVVLISLGFRVLKSEINSSIVIDEIQWENKISYAELKRLNKCKKEELEFRFLSNNKIEEVYHFIQTCRQERNASLSMTLAELKNTILFCSEDFLLFSVFQKDKMIAAAITIKVNNEILYDFYHAHIKEADQLSPVVMLIDGIYSYCQKNNFKLLDLGTSMLDDKINYSLLNFKKQLGAVSSMKLTFEKEL